MEEVSDSTGLPDSDISSEGVLSGKDSSVSLFSGLSLVSSGALPGSSGRTGSSATGRGVYA